MFTGIIEGLGTITQVSNIGAGRRLTIAADFELHHTRIGDSIAVNGACLTAVALAPKSFSVDVSPESLALSTLGQAHTGERVNLERALRLGDRLDGHLVSGHIDGTGLIQRRWNDGNAVRLRIAIDATLSRYMIHKGSVAVDGISLTINSCGPDFLELAVIPHTADLTTIGFRQTGARVNIETDMIGKYVERFVPSPENKVSSQSSLDMAFLARTGFL